MKNERTMKFPLNNKANWWEIEKRKIPTEYHGKLLQRPLKCPLRTYGNSSLCPTRHRPFGAAALLSLHLFSHNSSLDIHFCRSQQYNRMKKKKTIITDPAYICFLLKSRSIGRSIRCKHVPICFHVHSVSVSVSISVIVSICNIWLSLSLYLLFSYFSRAAPSMLL